VRLGGEASGSRGSKAIWNGGSNVGRLEARACRSWRMSGISRKVMRGVLGREMRGAAWMGFAMLSRDTIR